MEHPKDFFLTHLRRFAMGGLILGAIALVLGAVFGIAFLVGKHPAWGLALLVLVLAYVIGWVENDGLW